MVKQLLGFKQIKPYYELTRTLKRFTLSFEKIVVEKHFKANGFLLFESCLCVLHCSLRELFVREAHGGRLMKYFGMAKPLKILQDHLYWLGMKKDVEKLCNQCATCTQAKAKTQP